MLSVGLAIVILLFTISHLHLTRILVNDLSTLTLIVVVIYLFVNDIFMTTKHKRNSEKEFLSKNMVKYMFSSALALIDSGLLIMTLNVTYMSCFLTTFKFFIYLHFIYDNYAHKRHKEIFKLIYFYLIFLCGEQFTVEKGISSLSLAIYQNSFLNISMYNFMIEEEFKTKAIIIYFLTLFRQLLIKKFMDLFFKKYKTENISRINVSISFQLYISNLTKRTPYLHIPSYCLLMGCIILIPREPLNIKLTVWLVFYILSISALLFIYFNYTFIDKSSYGLISDQLKKQVVDCRPELRGDLSYENKGAGLSTSNNILCLIFLLISIVIYVFGMRKNLKNFQTFFCLDFYSTQCQYILLVDMLPFVLLFIAFMKYNSD